MRRIILFLFSIILLVSCQSQKTPSQLFEEQQSGVCVVLNTYYFEINIPNIVKVYCSGIDDEGNLENLTTNLNEAIENQSMATGTAFFIDKKGTLMTNRHVVSPSVSEDLIKKGAGKMLFALKNMMQAGVEDCINRYQALEQSKRNYYNTDWEGNVWVNQEEVSKIENEQETLKQEYQQMAQNMEKLNAISYRDIKVVSHNKIGIAYNGATVRQKEDFLEKNPCEIVKVSKVQDIDLATIRLKMHVTPDDKYVFKIAGINEEEPGIIDKITGFFDKQDDKQLTVGQKLIMIGFNAGLILGNTKQGIQAQMTTGEVTQKPDGTRLLYSIPTLQGSSGSPVIDLYGNVRAVNFAKLIGTDSFNFGIPENSIKKFLE